MFLFIRCTYTSGRHQTTRQALPPGFYLHGASCLSNGPWQLAGLPQACTSGRYAVEIVLQIGVSVAAQAVAVGRIGWVEAVLTLPCVGHAVVVGVGRGGSCNRKYKFLHGSVRLVLTLYRSYSAGTVHYCSTSVPCATLSVSVLFVHGILSLGHTPSTMG